MQRHCFVFLVALIAAAALPISGPAAADICEGVSPIQASGLVSVVVETGLSGRPLLVTAPPDDPDRIFIVEQDGIVWVKQRGSAPGVRSQYINISATVATGNNEQGLLGMAFAPDFATSKRFYLSFTRVGGSNFVGGYEEDPNNPNVALTAATGLYIGQPQPQGNHNGGHLAFGPDGYLYLGIGDGGSANDSGTGHSTCGNGQDEGTMLGSIIRFDPSGAASEPSDCGSGLYTIPSDNPFVDGAGGDCDEIWATGLRNPWRWDFDPATGDLYIADVGQNCWEEINYVAGTSNGGENYGWRSMEASHCFNSTDAGNCNPNAQFCSGSPTCNDSSLITPVLETSHAGFTCSITGGHVYRGCRISNLQGHYFWGDYCDGKVNSFLIDGGATSLETDWSATVDPTSSLLFSLTSFGKDAQGEIYVVNRNGIISKLTPPLSDYEVAGNGVVDTDQFLLNKNSDWSWEDLAYNAMFPLDYYSVYRGQPGGTFDCLQSTLASSWVGDSNIPQAGELFAYLVTASANGDESSGGTSRTLGLACSAP
jgi:glucose/arabinose dehydrogenase